MINEKWASVFLVHPVVFPVDYFDGVKGLKDLIYSCENEIKSLIGDVRIMFAMKKRGKLKLKKGKGESQKICHFSK